MASFLDSLRKVTSRPQSAVTASASRAKNTTKKPKADIVYAPSKKKRPTGAQLRYLFRTFSRGERLAFFLFTFLAAVGLAVGGGRYYFTNTEPVPVAGGEYIEAVIGEPQYINPLLSAANDVDADLERLVFSRLFSYNESRELESDIVTDYVLNDDQTEYTLSLRQDVYFSDGEQLNAEDVLFTVEAIQDPAYKSPLNASLEDVAVELVDDFTIKFILDDPFAPFLSSLTFGILPQHLWFDIPPANLSLAEANLKPIGSGPFKFQSLKKDKAGQIREYTVVRNEEYYRTPPLIEELTFMMYPDVYSAVAAAADKKVEGVAFVAPDELADIQDTNKNVDTHNLRLPQYVAIFFNQEKSDVLDEQHVREALAISFDRDRIISESLNGAGEVIHSPILPGYLGFNDALETYGFQQDEARELLKDKGWKKDKEKGYRVHEDETELTFTLTTVDLPEYVATANIIADSWKEIGIGVEVNVVAPDKIQKVIENRNYEALLFGNIIGSDPDPYPFWHSTQMEAPGLALSIFDNDDVDTLLEEARTTTDEQARTDKYVHFQNILAEEIPAIFLYNPFYSYAVTEKVEGIGTLYVAVPADRFANVTQWHIKTDRVWKSDEEAPAEVAPIIVDQPAQEEVVEEPATDEENTNTEGETTDETTTDEEADPASEDEEANTNTEDEAVE